MKINRLLDFLSETKLRMIIFAWVGSFALVFIISFIFHCFRPDFTIPMVLGTTIGTCIGCGIINTIFVLLTK
jgi:hypothetical protein